jgi:hypothetical protein
MLICDEEHQILAFLRGSPETFFSSGEICRKAGNKKMATKDPRWALPFLGSLSDKGLVERDSSGHYRAMPE